MSGAERNAPGEIDLESLRAGFAARSLESPSEPAGPCPEPGTVYDAVRGRLAPRELREVVEHVAACPRCAEEWRLAMAFEEEAAAGGEVAPDAHPGAARPRPPLRLVSVAASLVIALLAVGVWYTVGDGVPEQTPVFRDAGPGEIVPLTADGAPLDREDPVLRWRLGEDGAPAGTTYDVLVSTRDLIPVAEDYGLSEAEFRIPADALPPVGENVEIAWRVTAKFPEGGEVVSPTFVTPLE